MSWTVVKGDMRDVLPLLERESVDSIVCDPPYGLSKEPDVVEVLEHWLAGDDYVHRGGGFMGKSWDSFVPGPSYWRACYDALKPGGHLIAFGGTRTYDLMVIAVRLVGFEVRDQLQWLYGQGFPKSLDVSKAIDKAAGAEREVIGQKWADRYPNGPGGNTFSVAEGPDGKRTADNTLLTAPATPDAERWQGWGTALKPAHEPIVLARKPFRGTVASNVLVHGVGAINIDGCRIAANGDKLGGGAEKSTTRDQKGNEGWERPWMDDDEARSAHASRVRENVVKAEELGRWPANVVLDPESAVMLDEQTGTLTSGVWSIMRAAAAERNGNTSAAYGAESRPEGHVMVSYGDSGGASRFFYCAKTSGKERDAGLDGKNKHSTVKPIALMRWLQRLVTPPGGLTVDPFAGSGSSGCAAALEGFDFLGIQLDADDEGMVDTAIARITYWESTKTGEN